jgi:hypothetical protein
MWLRIALVGCCALLLGGITLSDDQVIKGQPAPSTPAGGKNGADAPKTLEEGLSRLEKTLGRYSADDQIEWRLPTSFEQRSRPDPAESEILLKFDGLRVVGLPFLTADGVALDEVLTWKREVYDLGKRNEKVLTRTQRSHNVTRYKLTLTSGKWLVTGEMQSNGVHSSQGQPTFMGVVRWNTDGFEIVGQASVDQFYAAGGKSILGASHGTKRYTRDGDDLVVRNRYQPYYLATDPDGTTILAADFKRPIGSVIEFTARSEAK